MKIIKYLIILIKRISKIFFINFILFLTLLILALSGISFLKRFDGMAERLHLTPNTIEQCKKTPHFKVSLQQAEFLNLQTNELESYCKNKSSLTKDWIREKTYWDYHYISSSKLENPDFNYYDSDHFNSRIVPCSNDISNKNILNVWAFGGSTTENLETSDRNTIVNNICKKISSKNNVSFVNLGVGSFYSEMEIHKLLNLLKLTIAHEKVAPPDIVLFYNGYNDSIRLIDGKWSGLPRPISDRYISTSGTRSNIMEATYWFSLSMRNFFLALTGDRPNLVTNLIERVTNKISNKKTTKNLLLAKRIARDETLDGMLISSIAYLNDQKVLSGICKSTKIKCFTILQPVLPLRKKPVGDVEKSVHKHYEENGLSDLTIRFYDEVRNNIKQYENNFYKVIDISNIINIEKYSNFPFFYDFGHTGFYAGEIIGNEISIELKKFNLF